MEEVAKIGDGRKGGAEEIFDKGDALGAGDRSIFDIHTHLHFLLTERLEVSTFRRNAVVDKEWERMQHHLGLTFATIGVGKNYKQEEGTHALVDSCL